MQIGHIYLRGQENGFSEYFVRLVEGVAAHGIAQHVVADNHELIARVAVCAGVSTGPCTSSSIVAVALMPSVNLVHIHDDDAGRAGLLLRLTRSMRYVITRRDRKSIAGSPILRAIYARADCVVARSPEAAQSILADGIQTRTEVLGDLDAENSALGAAEHIRVYRQAIDQLTIPTMLL